MPLKKNLSYLRQISRREKIVIAAAPPSFLIYAGGFFRKNAFGLIQEYGTKNMEETITEKDLEAIFAGKRKIKHTRIFVYATYLSLTILLSIIFFLILNGPSVITRVNYWYDSEFAPNTDVQDSGVFLSASPSLPKMDDNSILIERVDIKAPITYDVINSPNKTSKALENGAIHLANTAHPGEIGNVFVTGHSSNYVWAAGNYKSIFALLPKIVIGDQIDVKYQGKIYIYKVGAIKTVKPDDLSVLSQGKESILSLVTCVPVGTSLNRLVITANQTYPNPSTNINVNLINNTQKFPWAR